MPNCIPLLAINDDKPDDHRRDEAPKQYFISCILSEGNEFQGTGRKEGEKAAMMNSHCRPRARTEEAKARKNIGSRNRAGSGPEDGIN